MASRVVRMKFNRRAFIELRTSPEVNALLGRAVDSAIEGLGTGYRAGVDPGSRSRSRGYIVAADYEAIRENAKNHTLVAALSRSSIG